MARYAQKTFDDAGAVEDLIPDLVIPEVLASVAEEEVFMPLMRRIDLTGAGANSTIAQPAALTFTAYGADATAPDEQAFNTSPRTLTTAQRQLDVVIVLKALQDSAVDLQSAVVAEVGRALATDRDGLAAALYAERPTSAPDHLIGTDAVPLSFADLRDAQALLHAQRAPRRPKKYSWVVHTNQFAELLQDDTFINASVKGSPVLTQGIAANGYATSALDVDVYVSPEIDESSGRHSMMFAEGALGYAYKTLAPPGSMNRQELMIDTFWNSGRRAWEINCTYECHHEGLRDTPTTNKWLVDIIS